jgi:hypothetical protein
MTKKRQIASDLIEEGRKTNNSEKIQQGESIKEFAKLNNNSSYSERGGLQHKLYRHRQRAVYQENHRKNYHRLQCVSTENKGIWRYLGSAILWVSKMLVLDFIYNCLWTVFEPEEAKILYGDTDSLYIKFVGSNAPTSYEDLVSRFPKHLQERHFISNKSDVTPGKMKCEKLWEQKDAIYVRMLMIAIREAQRKFENRPLDLNW